GRAQLGPHPRNGDGEQQIEAEKRDDHDGRHAAGPAEEEERGAPSHQAENGPPVRQRLMSVSQVYPSIPQAAPDGEKMPAAYPDGGDRNADVGPEPLRLLVRKAAGFALIAVDRPDDRNQPPDPREKPRRKQQVYWQQHPQPETDGVRREGHVSQR